MVHIVCGLILIVALAIMCVVAQVNIWLVLDFFKFGAGFQSEFVEIAKAIGVFAIDIAFVALFVVINMNRTEPFKPTYIPLNIIRK